MKKIFSSILLLLLAVSFFQCRKEPAFVGEPDPAPVVITPDPITASLQGNILDENDQPAEGVIIKAGNQTTTTNAKGYFRINNASLDKKNALVIAEKSGYFKGIRHFSATAGTNYVSVKLIKKVLAGSITSGSGGTVSLSNGSKVSLPANGIIVASSGSNYSGTVNVYAQYIDPSSADIVKTVPGSFAAYDKDGKNVILTSYGMLAVELESAAGEKLQVKDGSTATLTSIIPAGAQASAPATISLWYVDEQTGLWREEGTGTKQGNKYTGTVKHFSFWNFDGSAPAVNLMLTLVNQNNLPIQYAAVRLSHPANPWLTTGIAFTDSAGNVSGLAAANESLRIEMLEPCNEVVAFSLDIAASATDINLGNVSVINSASVTTVKGRLLNCTNQPVTNGAALIDHNYTTIHASTNALGEYQAAFVMCSSAFPFDVANISGVDNDNPLQRPGYIPVNLVNAVNAPDILVCDALGYIHYSVDGVNYSLGERNDGNEDVYARIGDAGQGPIVMVYGTSMTPFRQMTMNMGGTTAATWPAGLANTFYATEALPASGDYDIIFSNASRSSLTIIANNNGEYYEGSMNVQYTYSLDGYAAVHTMNCTFRVKRRD